jgi:hemin uptake protein HemP
MMVETASDSNIKNHYSDFLIPTLKSLKNVFPAQFREVSHTGKTYLMKRVRLGKMDYQRGEDFILRGGYADSI